MQKEYRIDPELQAVMPKLQPDEKEELEKSLLQDGFKGAPIIVWGDTIIDGHNRYQICRKHNIPYEVQKMEFDSKDEVIQWMIRAQLGRRNLIDAQKIAIAEKFRPVLERQAKARQGNRNNNQTSNLPPMLGERKKLNKHDNEVTSQIAKLAGTGKETVRKAEKVLNSDKQDIKADMLSGKMSINAAHRELQRLEKEGRIIEEPKMDRVIPDEQVAEKLDSNNSDGKLKEIQRRCLESIGVLQINIGYLADKEFFSSDGDELSSRTQSELKTCFSKLQELKSILNSMREDDCGDENVIILEK